VPAEVRPTAPPQFRKNHGLRSPARDHHAVYLPGDNFFNRRVNRAQVPAAENGHIL